MMYIVPVRPWFAVPCYEWTRRCLGLVIVVSCLIGVALSASLVIMLFDISKGMLSLRYFYPPSEHFFKPVLIALLHAAIHIGVYLWFAVASFFTSRWQSRMRFNEYISLMVFGFLIMSLCEHAIFVALYNGVRLWAQVLGQRVTRLSFFYKFNELARYNIDRLQVEYQCCGGTASWMWHLIDWVGMQDEHFLPPERQDRLKGIIWELYTPRDQLRYINGLTINQLNIMANRSMFLCRDCPHIKPWSCCDDTLNEHGCQIPHDQVTWPIYQSSAMHLVNCTVGVYVRLFYDTMLDWGVIAELMSWMDIVIAVLAKYLDSASNEAMLSGIPDGPSRGYLMQRCCGWFCPKPGFMPEQPPPVAITYRAEEAPSGIFGTRSSDLEHQLDEQLDREVEAKKEKREERRQELRQIKIDKKIAKHRRNMGLSDADDDDDKGMDDGVDDEAEDTEANDDWGAD